MGDLAAAKNRPSRCARSAFASIEFAARPSNVALARRHAKDALSAWNIAPETVDTAVLLISELVTNACIASATRLPQADHEATVTQTLRRHPDRIVIEVSDPDPRPPVLTNAGPEAESGRGLIIVQALSKEWAWFYPPAGGKTVRCTLEYHETESQKS